MGNEKTEKMQKGEKLKRRGDKKCKRKAGHPIQLVARQTAR